MALSPASTPLPAGGSAPVHADGIDTAHAKALIEQVNSAHDIQTIFYNAPKQDTKSLEGLANFFKWVGEGIKAIAEIFKPLGPAMPFVVWGLVIVVVLLLLAPLVRLLLTTRFERLFARDNLKGDTPWRPSRASVAALLEEIDALAAKGQYDEAVHLLLVRSVADINAFRPDLVRLHFSARDICSHPLLPEAARPAFRRIVEWVEKSFFAGIEVGKAGFDACRAAYMDFVSAEGLA